MKSTFQQVLSGCGFSTQRAAVCADVFATNSLEGVYSHGVNRFAHFVQLVRTGYVDPAGTPSLTDAVGALERWDGNSGPGPLNALAATDRAMELADQHGMGCVALANTNHWMRAGYYGWRAARAGYVLIAWTNTVPLMAAWGAVDSRLGNNPMVIAVPYAGGAGVQGSTYRSGRAAAPAATSQTAGGGPNRDDESAAIVLDMAMSQFSYGKMELHRLRGEPLPIPGGYDREGRLTTDAEEILESGRALAIGFWKGAGLSLLLDLVASVLSGGRATHELATQPQETNVSQVYLAFSLQKLSHASIIGEKVRQIIHDYKNSVPAEASHAVVYPGERMAQIVRENLEKGIPVDDSVWTRIEALRNEQLA